MGFEKEELWIYNATCSETKGLIFEIIPFNCRSLKVLVFFMDQKISNCFLCIRKEEVHLLFNSSLLRHHVHNARLFLPMPSFYLYNYFGELSTTTIIKKKKKSLISFSDDTTTIPTIYFFFLKGTLYNILYSIENYCLIFVCKFPKTSL